MNLDIFSYIDNVLDIFDEKKEMFRLMAEEISDYFDETIASGSSGEVSVHYRIKTRESTREKIVRNNLVKLYESPAELLSNIQDLIGVRIECMFIQDEAKLFKKIQSSFTKTEDGVFYFNPFLPKIRLNLSEHQPVKQKNGFDIYKIDGVYLIGRESILFELQIKAMVNNFWGEIEHKIVYKNSSYVLADKYVVDLMSTIKGSLNMIDNQLATLYNQFHRPETEKDSVLSQMTVFLSKYVHDSFADLLKSQIGFVISFRESCDIIVDYLLKNSSEGGNYENYSNVMMYILHVLKSHSFSKLRLDEKLGLRNYTVASDSFVSSLVNSFISNSDVNFNWHLFCLMLFTLDKTENNHTKLERFAEYYKERILSGNAFEILSQLGEKSTEIKDDILSALASVISSQEKLNFISESGLKQIDQTLTSFVILVMDNLGGSGQSEWKNIKESYLNELIESF